MREREKERERKNPILMNIVQCVLFKNILFSITRLFFFFFLKNDWPYVGLTYAYFEIDIREYYSELNAAH